VLVEELRQLKHGDLVAGFVANFRWRRFVVRSLPVTRGIKRRRATMAVSCKGAHFPKDIILIGAIGMSKN
jgi:hypothetical protein